MNTLGDMCFAQFAKMYKPYSKIKSEEDRDNDAKQGDEVDEDDGYNTDDTEDRFNYIITHNEVLGSPVLFHALPDNVLLLEEFSCSSMIGV